MTIAWRVPLGESVGRLDADQHGIVFGSPSGVVRYVEPVSGQVRWQHPLGAPIWAAPALAADAVAVGTFDGRVVLHDRATGAVRWQVASGGPIAASPAITDTTVLAGNDAGHLLAFDRTTGALRWDLPVGAAVRAGIAVAGPTAIVATISGQLYAVDIASGICRWGYKAGGAVLEDPAIVGDRVVVGARDGITYGLRLGDGTALYGIRCTGPCVTPVAAGGGLLGIVDERGMLRIHRADTGQMHTAVSIGGAAAAGLCLVPGADPRFAVVEAGGGELLGVELASGAIRFRVPTGEGNRCVPVASGGLAVVTTTFGQLYGIVVPF